MFVCLDKWAAHVVPPYNVYDTSACLIGHESSMAGVELTDRSVAFWQSVYTSQALPRPSLCREAERAGTHHALFRVSFISLTYTLEMVAPSSSCRCHTYPAALVVRSNNIQWKLSGSLSGRERQAHSGGLGKLLLHGRGLRRPGEACICHCLRFLIPYVLLLSFVAPIRICPTAQRYYFYILIKST